MFSEAEEIEHLPVFQKTGFGSQYLNDSSQLPLTVVPENSTFSSGLCKLLDECGARKLI